MCDTFTKLLGRVFLAYLGFFGIVFLLGMIFQQDRLPMTLNSRNPMPLPHSNEERFLRASLSRDSNGVLHVDGKEWVDTIFGLGYGHAVDRWQQMCILRILGQGRLAEVLKSTKVTLYMDRYVRKMGFAKYAKEVEKQLDENDRILLSSYAEGVNEFVKDANRPALFVLSGYYPEAWTVKDIIVVGMIMPFFGLSDSQIKAERLIMESLQSELGESVVKEMFSPHLDDISKEVVELIRKVQLEEYFNGKNSMVQDFIGSPSGGGSNNWAISAKYSKSGKSIYASDPHIQIDRLPAIWQESVLTTRNNSVSGITCPGAPIFAMAKTNYISYGFTFAMSDVLDFMIEDCKTENGVVKCKSTDGDYKEAQKFTTTIERKGMTPVDFTWWETEFGMLELDPDTTDINGYYLSLAYSNQKVGTLGAINGFLNVLNAKTVKEAQHIVKDIDFTINFVFTDDENIGQTLVGNLPKRSFSGIYPKPAWIKSNHWNGFVNSSHHWTDYNPERGFIATANNEWNNPKSDMVSMNADLGPYRADRIVELIRSKISEKGKLDADDMKDIQCDVYSKQAESFMKILSPLLQSNTDRYATLLKNWDLRYDIDSKGATIFEKFLRNLYLDVYSRVYGKSAQDLVDRFPYRYKMDKVIINYSDKLSGLWKDESQEQLFSRVFDKTIEELQGQEIKGIGYENPVVFKNIFYRFLPSWMSEALGINQKIPIPGSFATPNQKNFVVATTGPRNGGVSWRMISDHQYGHLETALPGGPKDSYFSRLYSNDLTKWSKCQYKTINKRV
jgi:penicillin amidase